MHIPLMAHKVTRLAKWMTETNRDDRTVAAAVGITRSQINRLKNGASRPSWKTGTALQGLTGIPVQDLFDLVDAPQGREAAA